MFRMIVFLACVTFFNTFAVAQDSQSLKARCEEILVKSISNAAQGSFDALALSRARLVPFESVKELFIKGLESENAQDRFVAAEVLAHHAPMQFKKQIRQSLNELTLVDSTDKVRRAVLLMSLGDDTAKQEITYWAEHRFNELELNKWVCPMICVMPEKEVGKCPVCGMNTQKCAYTPDRNDWDARLVALRALQMESRVGDKACSIVVSDAPAFVRVQAAGLWAKDDLEKALPHVKVFLQSTHRHLAVALLAELAPRESVAEFKKILADDKKDDESTQWAARRGLLRAGDSAHLAAIRKQVEQSAHTESEEFSKISAIYLLGELGLEEDVKRLEKLLDTKFKVIAAESLLHLLASSDQSDQ